MSLRIKAKNNKPDNNKLKKAKRRTLYSAVKRSFDIAASAALIGASAPLMAVIAVLVRAESHGSAIYVHERAGKGGRQIRILKFRSMKQGSDDLEASLNDKDLEAYYQEYKLKEDPRVTEIGRMLRLTSLDELPQLFNVLAGSMSLVGPRPVMESELLFYTADERERFLSVKPGITGYWQVCGRSDATYQSGRRQEMELYYADNAGILLDVNILLKTLPAVLRKKGAY
ncbi:MAG: sugar transferase [Mogibacterium sp.]|nr:sugar transferase [Mogibacterium sp.]